MSKAPANKTNVTYFDLDEVAQEEIVIRIFGEDHKLKPVSVDDFIKNSREQEAADNVSEDDLVGQLGLTKKMLQRAFPTMPDDIFTKMTMLQLNKLVQLAHGLNGQKQAQAENAEAARAGNVLAATAS